MTDDRFDRDLAERLRAYEGRLPAAASPGEAAPTTRARRWVLIGVGALAAAAAILAVAVLLGRTPDDVGDASPSPVASASASGGVESREPSPSAGESAPPPSPVASTPASPTADLAWTEAGRFGSSGPATVTALVRHGDGLVAIGIAYDEPLPNLGPQPPHAARVWRSADGSSWEDVSPAEIPENTQLTQLVVAADNALVAYGLWFEDPLAGAFEPVAWESSDGERWTQIDSPFPAQAWVMDAAQGALGTVAIVVEPGAPGLAVWWTGDGRAWERVHDLGSEGSYTIGAGAEGFVVAGWQPIDGAGQNPVAWASGDGQAWLAAESPPGLAAGVAPRGPDWIAIAAPPETVIGEPSAAEVWSSSNGLEWAAIGSLPLAAVDVGGGACSEYPSAFLSAGPWLVAGTTVSYPCSEGGVQTRGAQSLSVDGTQWTTLPFGEAADEIGLGTAITGAVELGGRLVLAGERDGEAVFWVGEVP